jgi:MscS family membrane protein
MALSGWFAWARLGMSMRGSSTNGKRVLEKKMTNRSWLQLSRIIIFSIFSIALLAHAQVPATPFDKAKGEEKPAQTVALKESADFASPRDTINTFQLNIAQLAEGVESEAAIKQVLRTFDVPETLGKQAASMADNLMGVFNSLGRIDVETMAPGVDEVNEKKLKSFEFFPDNPYPAAKRMIRQAIADVGSEPPAKIVLVVTDSGEWKFSAETFDNITKLWSWIESRGVKYGIDISEVSLTQKIRTHYVPKVLKGSFFLGIELWQWVGLFVALFIVVLVDALVRLLLRPMMRWILYKTTGETDIDTVRATARPYGLLIAVLTFWWLLGVLGLVGVALVVLFVAMKLVFGFAVAWVAWSLTDIVSGASLRKSETTGISLDNMLIPLLRRAAKLLIFAFALVYTANALEVNLLPLLGSLGLAGLAVSFAAQDMVRNLFGGMTIFLDKPFKTGDRILYQNYDGIIEYIGFRSTKVRTLNGHLVTIPNAGLTGDAVENISARPTIRRIMNITLPLHTPKEKLDRAVQIIRDLLKKDDIGERIRPVINGDVLEPRVYFSDFNTDSLNLFVIYWFAPPDYWDYMTHCEQLNMRIVEAFEAAGIEFAIPIRKLQLSSELSQEPLARLRLRPTSPEAAPVDHGSR